jgi:hypothetical protein
MPHDQFGDRLRKTVLRFSHYLDGEIAGEFKDCIIA